MRLLHCPDRFIETHWFPLNRIQIISVTQNLKLNLVLKCPVISNHSLSLKCSCMTVINCIEVRKNNIILKKILGLKLLGMYSTYSRTDATRASDPRMMELGFSWSY